MPSPGFNQFPAGVPRIEPFPLEACNAINARLYLGKAPNRQPTYPRQTAKSRKRDAGWKPALQETAAVAHDCWAYPRYGFSQHVAGQEPRHAESARVGIPS